ncbi:MAG: YidC/Oxa1 family membrane protein insertase [Treponema sp.]|nr:YidC/Oxa1 family membrane protein insertase [Treponema sp.]
MASVLYTVLIYPIEQLIQLSYVFFFRVFNNPALSVLGVSFAVSMLTLPLYFMAEKHRNSEREAQKAMLPDVSNIKAVFSGDERFMRLNTYYRQKGYHPLYSLRSSISLIIQIPFFIAAYHFLSNLEIIKGVSFGPIKDLARPDSLFMIKNVSLNILPIAMTLINCVAALVYTKGLYLRDKIQLYGMAAVFLVLLYNSPSGMVLYWTGNNIFSLIKNIIQRTKIRNIIQKINFGKKMQVLPKTEEKQIFTGCTTIFILSSIILFLICAYTIPSELIASSVQEFSYTENFESPFPFIYNILLQSFGLFLLWPVCIYFMFAKNARMVLSFIAAVFAAIAIVNVFVFPRNYGPLTLLFTFPTAPVHEKITIIFNIIGMIGAAAAVLLLFRYYRRTMAPVLSIAACALFLFGTINCVNIYSEFNSFRLQLTRDRVTRDRPAYRFSKKGKNVLLIMLDRAIGGYLPAILDEKPELREAFSGFTWYKNTISFGPHTNYGISSLLGGYEYTPLQMQIKKDQALKDKHNEALLLLPRLFMDNGFDVSITDPTYANYSWVPDLSIFEDYPQINVENIVGKYTNKWLLEENRKLKVENISEKIKQHLIRFSLFKFTPLFLRNFIYDNGKWLIPGYAPIPLASDTYIALDILPSITEITENNTNNYNMLANDLAHEAFFLQAPEYIPTNEAIVYSDSPFAMDVQYHVNMAAMLLTGKWLNFLKENNVFDNTRIIIVSDHGYIMQYNVPENIILPNGRQLFVYTALLMVKDFNARGALTASDIFMTNADVPLIALDGIVENPVNPWTGKILEADKSDGVIITSSNLPWLNQHPEYQFNIRPNEWLQVRDNIYDLANWRRLTINPD